MIQCKGQLCKVEFDILLCKHNLVRTGQIYSRIKDHTQQQCTSSMTETEININLWQGGGGNN